jgi:phosphoketolase
MKTETLAATLSPQLLHKMDAYWLAANYLSVRFISMTIRCGRSR